MGWRTNDNYDVAREADRRAFLASLTWRERVAREARQYAPFVAGAISTGVVLWLIVG